MMRQGWCILNDITERTACEYCAFKNIQCEFFCETRADGENKLKSKNWEKPKSMDIMKNRLSKYNAVEREKDKILKVKKQQEQKKENENKKAKRNIKKESCRDTLIYLFILTGIVLIAAFPVAYIFVYCQIFTEAFYDLFREFDLESDPWFYSSYWERYLYCVLFGETIIGWLTYCNESCKNNVSKLFVYVATTVYIVFSTIHFNLFISTFIGTAFIAFGLWLNILKKGPI